MVEKKDIYFRIFRYNPVVDEKAYYDEFKVSMEKGITVLRALSYIKEHQDPKLTFRFFCQAGICGSCAIRINGVSKLACTTQVWDELGRGPEEDLITIEPLNNFSIKRDMVVDYDPVIDKLKKYRSWVEPNLAEGQFGNKEFIVSEKEFKVIDAATDCILCAACYSECSMMTANREYISPLALLKAYRMNKDTRDTQANRRLNILNKDTGMWDCTHCYRCVESCVKNIPIMDAIHGLRNEAVEKGMKRTEGYRHAVAFMKDIPAHGRLKELTLPLRTYSIGKWFKLIPIGFRMMLSKRMPPVIMHKSKGLSRVKSLFRKMKARKK